MRIADARRADGLSPALAAAAPLLALLLAVLLSGCASLPDPKPTPSPTATAAAPVFATDEEALAAATEAFAEYQAMSTEVAHDGGREPERMAGFASGEVLEAEIEIFNGLMESKLIGKGDLAFDSMSMQSTDLATGELHAYLCLDVSGTDLVDEAGTSKVPVDRPLRLPIEVAFVYDRDTSRLLVDESKSWSGTNFC